MSSPQETLLGELPVATRLVLGSEGLRLLFTDSRIVVDHLGKRGAGAVAGTSILGGLSSALENLFKSSRESRSKSAAGKLGPEQVLQSHKDNFAIHYVEVISVSIVQTLTLHEITVLTGNDKLIFSSRARFDEIVRLFKETLGGKLTVRRLVQSG